MKKSDSKDTAESIEVLKEYGVEVGRIIRVDLSSNGTLDSLVLGVRAIEQNNAD